MSARDLFKDIGKAVVDGFLRYVSVSQVTTFDPEQYGGCERRWYFEKVMGLKSETSAAMETGTVVHGQVEHYLKTGEDVLGMIARQGKHFMPMPGSIPHENIERPFGSVELTRQLEEARRVGLVDWGIRLLQEKHPPSLVTAQGIPFIGFIDVVNTTGMWVDNEGALRVDPPRTVELVDWKTSSNIEAYGKQANDLPKTVQMIGYAEWAWRVDPTAEHFRLSHGYMQTRGRAAEKRSVLIPLETVKQKWHKVEETVARMSDVARATDPMHVDGNLKSCPAYRGCPHRARCPRSMSQVLADTFGTGGSMSLLKRLQKDPNNNVKDAVQTPGSVVVGPTPTIPPDQQTLQKVVEDERTDPTGARAAAVKAEVERLKAEERGECPVDGAKLTKENSSRLPDGIVLHTEGCKDRSAMLQHAAIQRTKASVLPPDAPQSGKGAADPIPDETKLTLAPEVRESAKTFDPEKVDVQVGGAPVHISAGFVNDYTAWDRDKLKAEAVKRGLVQANTRTRDDTLRQMLTEHDQKNGAEVKPTETQLEDAFDRQAQGQPFEARSEPASVVGQPHGQVFLHGGIVLLVDVVVTSTVATMATSLDRYISSLTTSLCDEYHAADVRCAPADSPLGYGKWKGALAALVRAKPPEPGVYCLLHVKESEVKQVVVEALSSLCSTVIRGI